jgi:hypothetical protein
MVQVLGFVVALLTWWRRSPAGREAEIVFLRQQLIVLKRTAPVRPRLKATDRLIFVCLYRLFASLLGASIIFTPKTCHRSAFACSGTGNRGGSLAALPCRPTPEASSDVSVSRTLGVHSASIVYC